jgi:hypothetical protein
MLIALCGRPLTVESRSPPGEFTPGSVVTKLSALRLPVGSFRIWFVSIVVDTAADCVWMIWDPPATVTVSSTPPISMATFTEAGTPALTRTSLTTAVLKLGMLTVTV